MLEELLTGRACRFAQRAANEANGLVFVVHIHGLIKIFPEKSRTVSNGPPPLRRIVGVIMKRPHIAYRSGREK